MIHFITIQNLFVSTKFVFANTQEKRKVVVKKIIKSRRGSNSSITSSFDETGSTSTTTTDNNSRRNSFYRQDSDENVENHVATLSKLAKPTDYVPPEHKERPVKLSGLNYIVHRLPQSKPTLCNIVSSVVFCTKPKTIVTDFNNVLNAFLIEKNMLTILLCRHLTFMFLTVTQ